MIMWHILVYSRHYLAVNKYIAADTYAQYLLLLLLKRSDNSFEWIIIFPLF